MVFIMVSIATSRSFIVMGYCESASSSSPAMYAFTPLESARTTTMPMMPILPAMDVSRVRPFLLSRFVQDRLTAVAIDIEDLSFARDLRR